jgi:hypothetical protein
LGCSLFELSQNRRNWLLLLLITGQEDEEDLDIFTMAQELLLE